MHFKCLTHKKFLLGDASVRNRTVGRRQGAAASSSTWDLVKALTQVHCVNLSKVLPISGAEFCLPGMKVLSKVSMVCSSAEI